MSIQSPALLCVMFCECFLLHFLDSRRESRLFGFFFLTFIHGYRARLLTLRRFGAVTIQGATPPCIIDGCFLTRILCLGCKCKLFGFTPSNSLHRHQAHLLTLFRFGVVTIQSAAPFHVVIYCFLPHFWYLVCVIRHFGFAISSSVHRHQRSAP